MNPSAYFLDTNVLITAFFVKESVASKLLELGRTEKVKLLTNEYILTELRRALVKKFNITKENVESFILDVIAPHILILKKPSYEEVARFRGLSDRSDIPIIISCIKHNFKLVTGDYKLQKEAKKYVNVLSPVEALNEIAAKFK